MSKKIRTVTGDLSPEKFGQTMIHEHVVLDLSHVRNDDDPILSNSEILNRELERLKAAGCGGIVEVTNHGMGRDVISLHDISLQHDLPIVAATGYYIEAYYPPEVFEKSEDEIFELFVSEIMDGVGDTGIRAGIISEIGSSLNEMTTNEEKVFRAACRAQIQTGAPLSTHCELGTMGSAQLKLFNDMDVDLSKISIGHQDLNGNREEYDYLLKAGVYIQFDTIGKNNYRSEKERISDLIYLLDKGYVNQLMLSCDITKKSYLKVNGGFGYEYLFTDFLPQLKELGISQEEITTMMVDNPRRFLSF
ncbi:phosphotriesterase-related protein [Bacillus canaveralius]|uniref:Phosphotriesterase-related protein n=1 Tax=Bacillus canaveralius TaxID=1403243 RepID=A0A2N5GSD0_9BACI|nr:phosphotriesterase [Bacillus canaveralius]PLR86552.1 phosphotriesterase-related protein [Bacillus canaveralius]PLS00323.1 phosphotriesterase-related protein [Bacillus canaveralius]